MLGEGGRGAGGGNVGKGTPWEVEGENRRKWDFQGGRSWEKLENIFCNSVFKRGSPKRRGPQRKGTGTTE